MTKRSYGLHSTTSLSFVKNATCCWQGCRPQAPRTSKLSVDFHTIRKPRPSRRRRGQRANVQRNGVRDPGHRFTAMPNAFTWEPPFTCLRPISAEAWPRRAAAATQAPKRRMSGTGPEVVRLVQVGPPLPFPLQSGVLFRDPDLNLRRRQTVGRATPGEPGPGEPGAAWSWLPKTALMSLDSICVPISRAPPRPIL